MADFDQTVAVASDDRAVSFPVTLARGPVDLQTWFYDEGGKDLFGAYFVYVQRK